MSDMTFTMNELLAISTALDAQIEDCQEFLSNPNLALGEKVQLNKVIQYSKSASARLDSIFKENDVNPNKN